MTTSLNQPAVTGAVTWYFDFISPFAYLQWVDLRQRQQHGEFDATLQAKPILFAGLLKHHGHRGPAEIPTKRRFTYRYLTWLARRQGVAFRMPAAHPFNPLPLLRLALASADRDGNANPDWVNALFDYVWHQGNLPDDTTAMNALAQLLEVPDWQHAINTETVKQQLKTNTAEAIQQGVFGVPTLAVDGELFWGQDSTAMFMDFWCHPEQFADTEMQRVSNLPAAVQRQLD